MANFIAFSTEKLDIQKVTDLVTLPSCGAISIFLGTTRDEFEGKNVMTLEYEAYESMGLKVLEKICGNIRDLWPIVGNIVIHHRLGEVPVAEASVAIAISAPHREEAIRATEFCINKLKEAVPIWKKEVYSNHESIWKENKECKNELVPLKRKKIKFEVVQEVQPDYIPPHLIQIKASNVELERRMAKFIERKREDINTNNNLEFFEGNHIGSEFSCARIDSTIRKRKGSKSHLQVERVLNSYQHRDQKDSNYMKKYIPSNGIGERLCCLESQLSLDKPVPKNIYEKLKQLEDRLLFLESLSPEYVHFWEKSPGLCSKSLKKKIFQTSEIDDLIAEIEKKCLDPTLNQ